MRSGTKSETAIRTCNPNHEKCSKKWKLRFEDTKRHFHKHRDRLIETAAGHAAELTFDVLLQLSEILKSAKNSLADPGVNKDTIAYMRTLLDIYKVVNPIANPSETDGNPTSNPENYEDLKHRLAERRRLSVLVGWVKRVFAKEYLRQDALRFLYDVAQKYAERNPTLFVYYNHRSAIQFAFNKKRWVTLH